MLRYILLALLGGSLTYVAWLLIYSWIETKSLPREPMFWCSKHGPIPHSGVIKFMEHEVCGTCFHERLRSAEKGNL